MEEEVPDVVKNHIQQAEKRAVLRKNRLNKLVELSGLWRQSLEFERVALDDKMGFKEKKWKQSMEKEKKQWMRTRNQTHAAWSVTIRRARNHLLKEDVKECEHCIEELKVLLNNQKAKVKMVNKAVRMPHGKKVNLSVPVLVD